MSQGQESVKGTIQGLCGILIKTPTKPLASQYMVDMVFNPKSFTYAACLVF